MFNINFLFFLARYFFPNLSSCIFQQCFNKNACEYSIRRFRDYFEEIKFPRAKWRYIYGSVYTALSSPLQKPITSAYVGYQQFMTTECACKRIREREGKKGRWQRQLKVRVRERNETTREDVPSFGKRCWEQHLTLELVSCTYCGCHVIEITLGID